MKRPGSRSGRPRSPPRAQGPSPQDSSVPGADGEAPAPQALSFKTPRPRSPAQPPPGSPSKKEAAEVGRAQLRPHPCPADMGSYFGSSKHHCFLRQKNCFSKAVVEGRGIFNCPAWPEAPAPQGAVIGAAQVPESKNRGTGQRKGQRSKAVLGKDPEILSDLKS